MSEPKPTSGPTFNFPLSMIFALTAACAVMLAMLRSVVSGVATDQIRGEWVAGAIFGVGSCGAILGLVVGLYHRHWWSGASVGALAGGIAGALAGPLVLVPSSELATMWGVMVGGAILLVVAGLVMRYSSVAEPRMPYLAAWQPPAVSAEIVDEKPQP